MAIPASAPELNFVFDELLRTLDADDGDNAGFTGANVVWVTEVGASEVGAAVTGAPSADSAVGATVVGASVTGASEFDANEVGADETGGAVGRLVSTGSVGLRDTVGLRVGRTFSAPKVGWPESPHSKRIAFQPPGTTSWHRFSREPQAGHWP